MTVPFDNQYTGWPLERLDDVCTVNPGRDLEGKDDDLTVSKVPMAAVEERTGRLDPSEHVRFGDVRRKSLTHFREGDVVIAKISPSFENGKVAVATGLANDYAVGTTELHVLRPHDQLDRNYLLHFLLSLDVRMPLASSFSGTVGQQRISLDELKAVRIPLPPLDVQTSIVAELVRAERKLKRFEKGLRVLDSRLNALHASTIHSALAALEGASPRVSLGDVWMDASYGTSVKCSPDVEGVPVLRIPNIRRRGVDLQDLKYAPRDQLAESAVVEAGDLLVIRTNGSPSLVGRVGVVPPHEQTIACASYLIRLRFDISRVVPAFVALTLESPRIRQQLESVAASSAGQYNLSQAKLRPVSFHLPSAEHQAEIVNRVIERERWIRRLQRVSEKQAAATARLRRSILKAAFEGRLTSHDVQDATSPDDIEEAFAS